jgi:predicted transcriptional regulator of viral defense system
VYLSRDAFDDDMYVLQTRSNKAIFSHDTALYLHDLTDRDPLELVVTLPSGYNATRLKKDGIKVYFIKRSLHTLGVEEAKTIQGRSIRIYNKERTICDMIRNRSSMDIAIINEGVKRYIQSRQRNIPLLMEYANQLQIESILRQYLEALL